MTWHGMGGGRILDVLALWTADTMHFSICALGWTRERGLHLLRQRGTPQGIHCPVFEVSTFWTLGFPGGSEGKESTCNVCDTEMWVRSLSREDPLQGGGDGNPLHYSYLENPHGQRSLVHRGLRSIGSHRVGHS